MAHKVTVMPGDGIGREVMDATLKVLEATGVPFTWDMQYIGEAANRLNLPELPDLTLRSILRNRVAIKGPTGTPVGKGHRSINVRLREQFDLMLNVRPVRSMPIKNRFSDVKIDMLILRMNLGDLYGGKEHEVPGGYEATAPFLFDDCTRFARMAFSYAKARGRKKVVIGHKGNISQKTHGLVFLETAKEVAKQFPEIEVSDLIADNLGMQIVMRPERFDCILLPNFLGDLLSDVAAGTVGGLGFAAGANISETHAIIEAVHGTAPDIAGKGIANPSALILSGAMMLDHLGERAAAEKVRKAVNDVLKRGMHVTKDVNPDNYVGTERYAQAVCEMMWTS